MLVGHYYLGLVVGLSPRVYCSLGQQGLFQLGNLLDFTAEELVESVAGEAELTFVLFGPLEQLFDVCLFIIDLIVDITEVRRFISFEILGHFNFHSNWLLSFAQKCLMIVVFFGQPFNNTLFRISLMIVKRLLNKLPTPIVTYNHSLRLMSNVTFIGNICAGQSVIAGDHYHPNFCLLQLSNRLLTLPFQLILKHLKPVEI